MTALSSEADDTMHLPGCVGSSHRTNKRTSGVTLRESGRSRLELIWGLIPSTDHRGPEGVPPPVTKQGVPAGFTAPAGGRHTGLTSLVMLTGSAKCTRAMSLVMSVRSCS
ncbi:hypothetical protein EYF80_000078 [Liparis tanakae]|uniref:Uncharacterized protein n=1 Tax=Liparis tanakae TaxID=230148 RepID=A0A4Z2JGU5_9TELE|nr:hypothetical protein EYF80_000078 [Liparis tanakae]